jgi:uncharacterized membrane protein
VTEPRDTLLPLEAQGAEAAPTASPEVLISTLLRVGVSTSLALVVLGILVTYTRHPDWITSSEALEPLTHAPSGPRSLAEVVAAAGAAQGQALTMVGLLLLMVLPVARVGLSLLLFAQRRERAFALLTALVLGLLLLSFGLGHTEP